MLWQSSNYFCQLCHIINLGLLSDTSNYFQYHHHWHDSPLWAIAFPGFPDNRIFTGWGCQPHAKPSTRRTRPPYLWPPETGWPSHTPRHWVPILVAFYDTHELRWDYSYSPVTTRRISSTQCRMMAWHGKEVEGSSCSLILHTLFEGPWFSSSF
jgi:hypothetical protein